MMKPLLAAVFGLASFGLVACDQLPAPDPDPAPLDAPAAPPPPPEKPDETPQAVRAPIDWTAAREAMEDQRLGGEDSLVQGASGPPAPVPVILPRGLVLPAGETPSYRPLQDGYFANYPGPVFNVIVNGTNEVFDVPGAEGKGDVAPVFVETESGASVSLRRFGADYLIEFECNTPPMAGTCLTEAEALEIVDQLIVVSAQ